jgi:hypothetical protein
VNTRIPRRPRCPATPLLDFVCGEFTAMSRSGVDPHAPVGAVVNPDAQGRGLPGAAPGTDSLDSGTRTPATLCNVMQRIHNGASAPSRRRISRDPGTTVQEAVKSRASRSSPVRVSRQPTTVTRRVARPPCRSRRAARRPAAGGRSRPGGHPRRGVPPPRRRPCR